MTHDETLHQYEQTVPQHFTGYTNLDEASWARYFLTLAICHAAAHTPASTNKQEWETRFVYHVLETVFTIPETLLVADDMTLATSAQTIGIDFARVFLTTSPFINRPHYMGVETQMSADLRLAWANIQRVLLRLIDSARVVEQSHSWVLTNPTQFARKVNQIVFPVQILRANHTHHHRLGKEVEK